MFWMIFRSDAGLKKKTDFCHSGFELHKIVQTNFYYKLYTYSIKRRKKYLGQKTNRFHEKFREIDFMEICKKDALWTGIVSYMYIQGLNEAIDLRRMRKNEKASTQRLCKKSDDAFCRDQQCYKIIKIVQSQLGKTIFKIWNYKKTEWWL